MFLPVSPYPRGILTKYATAFPTVFLMLFWRAADEIEISVHLIAVFLQAAPVTFIFGAVHAVEKILHRHIQGMRQVKQPTGGNAVRAVFIFLHLLKYQPQFGRQYLLAHAKHQPPQSEAGANIGIKRAFPLTWHKHPRSSCSFGLPRLSHAHGARNQFFGGAGG